MHAIILAGGLGRRLHPYTNDVPKPLLPLGKTPLLEVILRQLHAYGFTSATLAVYYRAEQIRDYFGDGGWLGLSLDYSWSDRPLGTAGPLGLIRRPDRSCLVLNADVLTTVDFADVLAAHESAGVLGTIVLTRHSVPIDFGVVELNPDLTVQAYREKPAESHWVSAGIYGVAPDVWDYLPVGEYLDIPTLVGKGVRHGHRIASYLHEGEWYDIGTISQYRLANELFERHAEIYLPTRQAEPSPRVRAS